MSSPPPAPAAPPHGFWQRRVVQPIVRQLTQGVSPRQITFTLAIGTVCGLFPFLGLTWLVNLIVGILLRLNQPILQTLNQLLTPLHLLMIVAYIRVGEWMWGAQETAFSITELVQDFAQLSIGEFLTKFGWAGVHAFSAWVVSAPLVFCLVYLLLRPVIARLARLRLTNPLS